MGAARREPSAIIAGVGARTPSGLTPLQVTMSARADKLRPRASHLVDGSGEPIATTRLRSIADNVMGLDRFVALGAPAVAQAAFPWTKLHPRGTPTSRLPVALALPSRDRPGLDARLAARLIGDLEERSGVALDRERSARLFVGRAGGIAAVEAGLAVLKRAEVDAVLVGGIDTYFDPDGLEHLDRELRLHGPSCENGFIPGEGAGFALLVAPRGGTGLARLGSILSVAVEEEPHPYGSPEPCLAEGITRAVSRALADLGSDARPLGWALTDVVDERHRVDEWAFAAARSHRRLAQTFVHEQPLLVTGDLGAASAAVLLAIACVRWQTGCAVAERALIAAHSDGPPRGAMVAAAP